MPYEKIARALELLPQLMYNHRKDADLSRDEVSQQMGVSKDTIARLENGDGITVATAIRAFKWLAAH